MRFRIFHCIRISNWVWKIPTGKIAPSEFSVQMADSQPTQDFKQRFDYNFIKLIHAGKMQGVGLVLLVVSVTQSSI